MALEDIIKQIDLSAQNEIEKLKKEASLKIREIDQDYNEKIGKLRAEKEAALEGEKENLLAKKEKEQKYQFEMKILEIKNEILNKAFAEIKKHFKNLSFAEKKEFLKKEIEKISHFINEKTVFISEKEQEIKEILQELKIFEPKIVQQNIGFKNDLLIENEDFTIEISLESIVEDALKENKNNFAKTLWQN